MLEVGKLNGLIQSLPVEPCLSGRAPQPSLAEPVDGERIDDVFLRQHAFAQRDFRIGGLNGHARLQHARSAIELLGYKMHRYPVLRFPRGERAPMSMQSRVFGLQRGMNVQDSSGEALHQWR